MPITQQDLQRLEELMAAYTKAIEALHGRPPKIENDQIITAMYMIVTSVVPQLIAILQERSSPIVRHARITRTDSHARASQDQGRTRHDLTLETIDDIVGATSLRPPWHLDVSDAEFRAITAVDGWMERPIRIRIDGDDGG